MKKYKHIRTGYVGHKEGEYLVVKQFGRANSLIPMSIVEGSSEWEAIKNELYSWETDLNGKMDRVLCRKTEQSFNLGDRVCAPGGRTFEITSFYFDAFEEHILCGPGHVGVRKVKIVEPVGRTDDGVYIYPGETIVAVRLDDNHKIEEVKVGGCNSFTRSKTSMYFSTMEEAEKWLTENWNCLNVKDVSKVLKGLFHESYVLKLESILNKLVQARIKKLK